MCQAAGDTCWLQHRLLCPSAAQMPLPSDPACHTGVLKLTRQGRSLPPPPAQPPRRAPPSAAQWSRPPQSRSSDALCGTPGACHLSSAQQHAGAHHPHQPLCQSGQRHQFRCRGAAVAAGALLGAWARHWAAQGQTCQPPQPPHLRWHGDAAMWTAARRWALLHHLPQLQAVAGASAPAVVRPACSAGTAESASAPAHGRGRVRPLTGSSTVSPQGEP